MATGTGGGLVNMTRGLGTALGVALVPLALLLAGGGFRTGSRWAAAVLVAACAVAATAARPPSLCSPCGNNIRARSAVPHTPPGIGPRGGEPGTEPTGAGA
ncbi:hypothetical protein AQI95_13765 [Streptomyces yokosukanensis]|uniref:Uncharacterized protein n=1 Tax=Streptomyces yokosukanensis TaxID=67386 RepID=A0A117Q2S3_9ACTN|nr:hypothetical protein [Streptomyces yokosukanensis]KUN05994.1 hypothetical protein AQI95_13765 [Streptomyces yokosukanensis]